jgi:hypothetical protein
VPLRYRYLLHLVDGENEEVVRYARFTKLVEDELVEVRGRGQWRVRTIFVADDESDTIAYCDPATHPTAQSNGKQKHA